MRALALVLVPLFLVGCASLLVEESDPAPTKAAKIAARTLLGVGTLGVSEVEMASIKEKREFQEYLETIPPEERWRVIEERERRKAETAQAIGSYMMMRNLQRTEQKQEEQKAPTSTNCRSYVVGNILNTDCDSY